MDSLDSLYIDEQHILLLHRTIYFMELLLFLTYKNICNGSRQQQKVKASSRTVRYGMYYIFITRRRRTTVTNIYFLCTELPPT